MFQLRSYEMPFITDSVHYVLSTCPMTWNNAVRFCEERYQELLIPRDNDEHDSLIDFLIAEK